MTTVLPAAPPAPSTLPAEPRPSVNAERDDESFAQLLDQHTSQRSTKEPAARRETTEAEETGDLDPPVSQVGDEEDDDEEVDAALLIAPPQLPSRHAPVLFPLGEHFLFSPEMLSSLKAGLQEIDAAPSAGRDAEAGPISTTPGTDETSNPDAPRRAMPTAVFPIPMVQIHAQWTAPTSVPQTREPQALDPRPRAPLSAALPTSPTSPTFPRQSTPGTQDGLADSVGVAVRMQPPSAAASPTRDEHEILPVQIFAAAQIATPRVSERSAPAFVRPAEIATSTATPLPIDGQNLPQGENLPQARLDESPVAPAAPRTAYAVSKPTPSSPATEVTASAAAPAATPKVDEQTRAQIPVGTPAAKRGEVMPNSALQAAPTLRRATPAGVLERPAEAGPEGKIASAPTAPTTFTDAPATAISSGPVGNPARGERGLERHPTPEDTRREIDSPAPAHEPAARPDFEYLRPELSSAPNAPRDEATISRTEMTRIIDRTTDAVVRMRAAGTERLEVAVQLESGAKLTIQLRMANGEVTPFIRTNSEALRTALEQNWSQFSDRSAERSVRLTPPVFEAGQSASNMTDLSQQRHGRDTSHSDRQAETFHFIARRPQVAPATSNGPTRIAPATDGLNLYA